MSDSRELKSLSGPKTSVLPVETEDTREDAEDEFAEERALFSIDENPGPVSKSDSTDVYSASPKSHASDEIIEDGKEEMDSDASLDSAIGDEHALVDESGRAVHSKKEVATAKAKAAAKAAGVALSKMETRISGYLQKRKAARIGMFNEERLLSVSEERLDQWRLLIDGTKKAFSKWMADGSLFTEQKSRVKKITLGEARELKKSASATFEAAMADSRDAVSVVPVFEIETRVFCSTAVSKPTLWKAVTMIPGAPSQVLNAWLATCHRRVWDESLKLYETFLVVSDSPALGDTSAIAVSELMPEGGSDGSGSTARICHTVTKSAVGGLVSSREFVDFLIIDELKNSLRSRPLYEDEEDDECDDDILAVDGEDKDEEVLLKTERVIDELQISSCSVRFDQHFPRKDSVYRGNVHMSGLKFSRVNPFVIDEDFEEDSEDKSAGNGLVTRTEEADGDCLDWTKVEYLLRVDLSGWLTAGVVDLAMSQSLCDSFALLSDYIVKHKLYLPE